MSKIKIILLLLFFFAASLVVRLPKISKSDYTTNECHIFLLNTIKIWNERGIAACHFSPIQTYSNPGDKRMNYFPRLISPEGDNYYVSYPPFIFMFTYALFNVLMIIPSVYSLTILNFILHFISACFVFFIVRLKMRSSPVISMLAATSAYIIYLFVPVMMELHTVIFFPEMLGQVLFLVNFYLLLQALVKPEKINKKFLLLFGLLNFILVYTEWMGLFFTLTGIIICSRKSRLDKRFNSLNSGLIISAAASLLLTFIQYASISGPYNLFRSLALRAALRSGYLPEKYSEEKINIFSSGIFDRIFHKTNHAFYLFFYLAGFLLLVFIIINKNEFSRLLKKHIDFILLCTLPVILHLFLFANFTLLHNHAFAKICIPLAIGTGLIAGILLKNQRSKILFFSILILISVFSSFFYLQTYPDYRAKGFLVKSSEFIKQNISREEAGIVNIQTKDDLPDVVYLGFYTGRNLVAAANIEEAKQFAAKANQNKIAYFYLNEISGESRVEHIDLEK